ncbi:MAG: hypothetical protein P9M03_02175 [Candidatus Theseobacter exili]|nr:hypothetical protein [Candidatus Theseobacter exili]
MRAYKGSMVMGNIWIGTSGFSYGDWYGVLYPENIRKGEMIEKYSGVFKTVEINLTY